LRSNDKKKGNDGGSRRVARDEDDGGGGSLTFERNQVVHKESHLRAKQGGNVELWPLFGSGRAAAAS